MQIHCIIFASPPKLCILNSELHTFCSQPISQLKAPILLCKSVSSYRKKVKLTFELQGKCQKTCGLILYRKIRCFLKRTRFLTYFELPVGSSQVCKDFASKTPCFFAFLQFPSRELEQTCHFRMEAPRPRHSENDKIANMLDHKAQELSTYMKNKKILRVRSSTTFAPKRKANA